MQRGFIPQAPGQNVTAIKPRTWNAIANSINHGSVGAGGNVVLPDAAGMNAGWVWIKNTSGTDRNRFDCMALGDPTMALTTNGQVDVVFGATTADPLKSAAILLEPIANGRVGRAVIYGLCLAYVEFGSTTVLSGVPEAATNHLKPGGTGQIKLLTAPSASVTKLIPVIIGAGGGDTIYKYTLEANMGTSANATIIDAATGATLETGKTLNDTIGLAAFQVTGGKGICFKRGTAYYVIVPECEGEEGTGGSSGG